MDKGKELRVSYDEEQRLYIDDNTKTYNTMEDVLREYFGIDDEDYILEQTKIWSHQTPRYITCNPV